MTKNREFLFGSLITTRRQVSLSSRTNFGSGTRARANAGWLRRRSQQVFFLPPPKRLDMKERMRRPLSDSKNIRQNSQRWWSDAKPNSKARSAPSSKRKNRNGTTNWRTMQRKLKIRPNNSACAQDRHGTTSSTCATIPTIGCLFTRRRSPKNRSNLDHDSARRNPYQDMRRANFMRSSR